ncbi:hypothetical protein H0H92_005508 [Tricholoma furcatifolium]|nr:hypothetical protein H0H92_005508 [Tricholoma furcatifolium]
MKIIVIGAGIGGLSVYHSLKKNLPDDLIIKVYESYGSPTSTSSKLGGGLGLAPNGLRAIASVSPTAAECIQARGAPGFVFTFRNSSGKLVGNLWSGRKERYGFSQLMVRRALVHEGLLQDVPDGAITWNTAIKSVQEVDEGAQVTFADGLTEVADLVIGADGLWSVVRDCIFNEQYKPFYDGFTGVGGFVPISSLSERLRDSLGTENVVMTFGEQGFFGYSVCSSYKSGDDPTGHSIQWWSIYESAVPLTRGEEPSVVRDRLLALHGSWKSPHDSSSQHVYEEIIKLGCTAENASSGNLLVLPRYEAPRMPRWTCPSGTGRIILIGDSAHPMPPDSGQGASCAVEDAVALGALLKKYHATGDPAISDTLKRTAAAYEDLRMKRVWKILDIAKRSGGGKKKKQSWLQQWIRDCFLGLFCKLPESLNDWLLAYDAEAAVLQYSK